MTNNNVLVTYNVCIRIWKFGYEYNFPFVNLKFEDYLEPYCYEVEEGREEYKNEGKERV